MGCSPPPAQSRNYVLLIAFLSFSFLCKMIWGENASWANSMWLSECWQGVQKARKMIWSGKGRYGCGVKLDVYPIVCLFLQLWLRWNCIFLCVSFISFHCISFSTVPDEVVVCVCSCVSIWTCSHNNTKRFIECRYRCLCRLRAACTWPHPTPSENKQPSCPKLTFIVWNSRKCRMWVGCTMHTRSINGKLYIKKETNLIMLIWHLLMV